MPAHSISFDPTSSHGFLHRLDAMTQGFTQSAFLNDMAQMFLIQDYKLLWQILEAELRWLPLGWF